MPAPNFSAPKLSAPTRRTALGLIGAGLALTTGCAGAARPEGNAPGWGRLLVPGDARPPLSETRGQWDGRAFTLDTPFRIASVSKVLVAELARRLAAQGRVELDTDVSAALGRPFRHPDHPDTPITLRQLLSHTSGVRDPDVYWMALPGDIRDLLGPDNWEPGGRPGTTFRYSNLNYGLAATTIEAQTGARFDQLFVQVIARPLGLDIGFNWSGVSAAKRAAAFPGVRGAPGDWTVQVDGPQMRADPAPAILREDGASLDAYIPGTNGTLFSPQGGLRASLSDMAAIARALLAPQPGLLRPVWAWDGRMREGGPSEGGHFTAFGEGVYLYPEDRSPLPGRALIGHHGEAYGIYCGMWLAPETGDIFVHADLGSPPDGSPMTGGMPNLTEAASSAFAWWRERL